ncbi:MAG: FAD-dependent monooxygenase [Alphaproteobacteria bacterium]
MTSQETAVTNYDCVIVGGGVVGLALGLALDQAGIRAAIIERQDPATIDWDRFDGRALSVAHGQQQFLTMLGAWDAIAPHAQAMKDILVTDGRVSEGAAPLYLHFDHRKSTTGAPLAHMVEHRYIRKSLLDLAQSSKHCRLLHSVEMTKLDRQDKMVTIELSDGTIVTTPLIVAAEGAMSPTRKALGFEVTGWDYNQKGIVTTVEHDLPHHGVAQEYFLPGGPFAVLPLPDDEQSGAHRASLVWTEATDVAETIMALDEDRFTEELRKRFGDYLGTVAPVGPRYSYPLRYQQALDFAGPRAALIGDAAHVVHPLAGQGMNLGLKDAAALAEVIVDASRLGLDWGSTAVLGRYEKWRRADTLGMAVVTDGLNRLFSNDNPILRIVRDVGLALVDRLEPVKRRLMAEAQAATGPLPRLMQGEKL